MKIGFVFSGQGAQYLGMGKEFYETSPIFKNYIDRASELLAIDMPNIMFNDEEILNLTEFTQPIILTMSLAISEMIKTNLGIKPEIVSGLSLGEYSALVESGALDFQTAVSLVRQRGKFMQEAVPKNVGAMTAVMGLDREIVKNACLEASEISGVYPANFNMPGQIVIGGYKQGVSIAEELLKERGAKRLIPLTVSGPFHTPLLEPAAQQLNSLLETMTFQDMLIPVVTNVSGEVIKSPTDIKETLTQQVMSPVYFEDCIKKMIELKVDMIIEIGPGRTLCSFIKKIDKSVQTFNVDNQKTFDKLAEFVDKNEGGYSSC